MGSMRIFLGFLLLSTLLALMPESIGQDAAVVLKASLLANYDKSLRLVKFASTPVNVAVDISLRQIIELGINLSFTGGKSAGIPNQHLAAVGFSCLASIVVIRLSYSSPPSRPLPRWLRLLLLRYLARLFCMNTIAEEKHENHDKEGVYNSSDQENQTNQQSTTPNLGLDLSLREIVRYSREYSAGAREKKGEEADQDDWKMAVLVVDRALMFVVGLASIMVCVMLLR
uniref:Neurotransmitter-gated ion-channel transmembrane domain-containing protein n=1 Tax=Branchiostoma floridae TaxID=7739 RepID=C3YBE2_BRAFL|eukprot:XP_002606289.1 hypothetical protein BRAFLDRAFT_67529 [Branchiostoma floridae]